MTAKAKVALLLGFVYGLGLASGVAWHSYHVWHHWPGRFVERRIEHLSRELHLTPEQEVAVRDAIREAHERTRQVNEEVSWDLDDIHRDTVQTIQKVLTPAQQREFERLHRRMHQKHHTPVETDSPPAISVATASARPS